MSTEMNWARNMMTMDCAVSAATMGASQCVGVISTAMHLGMLTIMCCRRIGRDGLYAFPPQ